MKLIKRATNGNRKIISTTSKVVPEPEFKSELGFVTKLEFNVVVELEFNKSLELFNMAVEFKSKSIL